MIRHARALFAVSALLALSATPAAAVPPEHPERPDLSHSGLQRACGVATDPLGNLYVSQQTSKTVSVFAPDGSPLTSFTTTADLPNAPCQIAVDSSGDVYVVNSLRTQAVKFSPSAYPPTGATTYPVDATLNGNGKLAFGGNGDVASVAVNPATDEVYLAEDAGNEIQEFAKPAENYELELEDPSTKALVKSGPLTSGSSATAIQEALRSALCGAPSAACLAVADVTTRWRVTFNGTATTPVTASKDIAAIKVLKAGGNETAYEMFDGTATDRVRRFTPSGAVVSKTIGAFIAGANFTGIDVYAKNGNVYLADEAKGKAYVLNPAGDSILSEFDGSDSLAGAFGFAGSLPDIAVDQSNGHAYVTDIAAHGVVSEFDGAGSFVSEISHDPAFKYALPSTVAVDGGASSPSKGVVYVTAFLTDVLQAEVFAFGPLSEPLHLPRPDLSHSGLQRACGVATDPLGNLYVSQQTSKTVSVFAPDGSPLTSFTTTADLPNAPCQIAVDSSGDVYVVNSLRTQAVKFSPSAYPPTGATTYPVDATLNGNGKLAFGGNGDVASVAVNPATDEVYLAEDAGNEIQEFAKPAENYELELEDPSTKALVKSGPLTSGSSATAIQEALRSALCGAPSAACLAVADVTTRWRVTFNGTATTPVTASKDIAAIKVLKAGGNETAYEMFDGTATDRVRRFTPSGAVVSKTIGAFIAGANFTGIDVYAKNGNVYLADEAKGKAYVLNPAGDSILSEFDGSDSLAGAFGFAGSLPDIAVDQSNGHAYVTDIAAHGVVSEFDGAGSFVSEISHDPAFKYALPSTVAVDGGASSPSKGVVYVTAFLTDVLQAEVFAFGPLTYAFPLKVTKTGHGDGTVTSIPSGIECGAVCEGEFEAESLVKLAAAPTFGSQQGAWSGCDAVNLDQECEVTMSGAREASVHFDSRPVVSEQTATQVTASSAQLLAKVNPQGKATTYRFEYIAEADWLANGESFAGATPATKAPLAPLAIGTGTSPVAVGIKVEGLASSTAYRFRVVATNDTGTAEGERDPKTDAEIERSFATYAPPEVFGENCPNDAYRTGPSASLPDCRAWEQASPVDKNGGSIQGTALAARTAGDGSTITFESTTGVPGGSGSQNFPTYMAKRGAGGWSTTGLLPSPASGQRAGVLGWSADFATAFSEAELFGQGTSLVARDTATGTQAEIVPHTPPPDNPEYAYVGTSEDGETVLFEARPEDEANTTLQLTPDAAAGKPNLYAWDRETGELHLAGVLPDGSTSAEGSRAGKGLGNLNEHLNYNRDSRLVAEDGSAFFNDRGDGQLYLRLNPTADDASTVHVSASQKTNGKGPGKRDSAGQQPAHFMAASPDGSVVTFTSSEKLTNDANTGPEPDAPAIARAKASDGGEKDLDFILAFAREIAVDEVEGYVYWSDPEHGQIGRAKLDGTEITPDYIPDLGEPLGIAVINEPTAKYVFWTERGPLSAKGEPQVGQGAIGRADLDGTDVNPTCYEDLTNPRSIAVRPDFIYWTTPDIGAAFGQGNVGRAEVGCNAASAMTLIDDLASGDIAVDANHIYFSLSSSVGFIRIYNLDGTEAGPEGGAPIVQIPDAQTPPGLALDGSHLYWTNPTTNKIGRSDLDGTNATEEHSFITEAGRPEDLARGGTDLLWTANQGVVSNPGTDIYQLDRESGILANLAPDSASTNGVEVQGVLGTSEGGSYVYFAANGVPDGVGNSPNAMGEEAQAGSCKGTGNTASGICNLYVAHDGSVDFIASLNATTSAEVSSGDALNWIVGQLEAGKQDSGKTARVSADGRVLVFRSQRQLTAYDNQGPRCIKTAGNEIPGPCLEFYRFDHKQMSLACVSCDPRGTTPNGPARLASVSPSNIGAPLPAATLARNLSRDGNRFFFETPDAMVAEDTNGQDGCPAWGSIPQTASSRACQDVYEWEAPGTGSCTESSPAYSEQNQGCIYLISTGKSEEASFFADADLDGENVFIYTYEQLVPQDTDALLDAYDARVGGGLASQHQVQAAPCAGETCKAPPSPPSAPQSPGSSGFAGPTDPHPKRAQQRKRKRRKQARQRKKRAAKAKQRERAKQKQRATTKTTEAGR